MPYYRVSGEIPRKRHTRFLRPGGGLYAEELMGEEGFSSDSSLLYHVHPPTAIVKSEALADVVAETRLAANHPLLPRHYRTQDLAGTGDVVLGRQPLMAMTTSAFPLSPSVSLPTFTGTRSGTRPSTCTPARCGSSRSTAASTRWQATT